MNVSAPMMAAQKSFSPARILDRIGNTPLVFLEKAIPKFLSNKVEFYAKLEWFNPGGSVKDRPAYSMVQDAIQRGVLTPEKVLIDATSGNTGIAFAMIGAAMGFRVKLVMPENVSKERVKILECYGAKAHYSDPLEGSDGARSAARKLVEKHPDKYFYADQYSNDANWRAHFETTGPEIWRQTDGRITHFVCAVGTSGTMMGTARFLKSKNPNIKAVAIQPEPFHGIEGWKNMDAAVPVKIFDRSVADLIHTIPTEPAYQRARELAGKEGLFASPSAGGVFHGALEVLKDLEEGVVVMVFADSGDRYLSLQAYGDKKGGPSPKTS